MSVFFGIHTGTGDTSYRASQGAEPGMVGQVPRA